MNMGQIRRRGWLLLILTWLIVLTVGGVSNSVVSAQAPATTVFFDDFAGTSLHPAWTIINQDANRFDLIGGNYLLLVLNDQTNKFCYGGAVPDRYEFTAKVLFDTLLVSDDPSTTIMNRKDEYFDISMKDSTNQGIEAMISTSGGNDLWLFQKTVGTQLATISKYGPPAQTEYYVKIRKDGIQYTGYVSHDGHSWYTIGQHFFPGFVGGRPCFGAIANTKAEKGVKVDYAEIKALPPPHQ